jgi:hypothetical protein
MQNTFQGPSAKFVQTDADEWIKRHDYLDVKVYSRSAALMTWEGYYQIEIFFDPLPEKEPAK